MQDLIYGSEVWRGNDKRRAGGRKREMETQTVGRGPCFDCSPVHKHYIFYEIYSLRLSSGEFSLLGSLFVFWLSLTLAGMYMYACGRLNFIHAQIGS